MKMLPVYQHRKEILNALQDNQVIIVESPTGSGKTTQLPIILHEAGYTDSLMVGITQPRRIATLSVSDFIRKQVNKDLDFVGYKMRFDDTTSLNTKIKVMTDGILLMELKADPLLKNYGVILVDEAHERSLNIDFILGLLQDVMKNRPDFKVIISSATINTKVFSQFFGNAPVISIDSKIYPIDVFYRPLEQENIENQVEAITKIVMAQAKKHGGDILVFMSGEFDITACVNSLYMADPDKLLEIYPLFGRLSKEEQESVFNETGEGKTKVVVSTNIAETSVTIDGITTVIDTGIAKINFYNQKDFTSSLVPLPTSRSSCDQRKGRAGRTAPGVCFRLYSEEDFKERMLYGTEEILRTDLSEVVLRMSDLGIYDYEHFPFITRPKNSAITSAEETLRFIGAIDENRRLTTVGALMCKFPLLPRHSRVLVEALVHYPDVLEEVLIAVAFLSTKNPFLFVPGEEDLSRAAHKRFSTTEYGDFVKYLNLFKQYTANTTKEARQKFCKKYYLDFQGMQEIVHVDEQLGEICGAIGFPLTHGGNIREYLSCIASGLLQYICIRTDRNMYKSLTANQVFIHPGSAYFKTLPQFIIAGEIVQTSRMYARSVSPLEKEWLDDISPDIYKQLVGISRPEKTEISAREKRKLEQEEQKIEREEKSKTTVSVYKRTYPTVTQGKKNRMVAIIPLEDLAYLYQANEKAPKRPKNFSAALIWQGFYIHYGDKFFSILDLHEKIDLAKGVLDNPPSGVFTINDGQALVDNLKWILTLCKSKKERKRLGFVSFEESGDGNFRFTFNHDGFDALDESLYNLLQLADRFEDAGLEKLAKQTGKLYGNLLKLVE
ncbi:ATP-dependent RNA helicase [Sphaerochaeta sp. PS]|uniref:ATP-dependent RNA helicase n=1 Tax=Sphaerochaeta sp. PS TaxID=3076336 RepID=UPI0028A4F690|nr:ATP-dependent RNA helicase [Sphaerochaeta sp. PS]MDT4761412.1 ATP-dependent RNA helicase [Sphaerochaeta sp. PS]